MKRLFVLLVIVLLVTVGVVVFKSAVADASDPQQD